jgi:hypothetical protein
MPAARAALLEAFLNADEAALADLHSLKRQR